MDGNIVPVGGGVRLVLLLPTEQEINEQIASLLTQDLLAQFRSSISIVIN